MRSPVVVLEKMTAIGWDVTVAVPMVTGDQMSSDRDAFERERLISLIIDVGMMRRDVATDVAEAITKRWPLLNGAEIAVREQAYQTDIAALREKLARVHKVICEANASLQRTCRGEDKDVDDAASKIALAIRLAA